jgi:hypothetical protein
MNANVNGNQDPDDVWADYPDLGFDDDAVYLTSNQFDWGGPPSPQYNKIRIFKKSELYAGQPLTFVDFWNLTNVDGSRAFTVKPAHHFGNTTSAYLVNTKWEGWDRVTVWRVDNPGGSSPSLVRHATHFVEPYIVPPTAPQLGSNVRIETQDCRAMNAVYKNGYIHTTFTEGYDWQSDNNEATVRYLKISTIPLQAVEFDVRYGANNEHYFHPAVYIDNDGNTTWLFNRSSQQEYAGIRYTYSYPGAPAFGESALLKSGEYCYTFGSQEAEFGDYSGVALDPIEGTVWMHSEYAKDRYTWGTWIGAFSPNVPVRFSNVINEQLVEGSLRLDETEDVGSGSYKPLTPNSSHTIRTFDERYPNYQGTGITYKQHDWNGVETDYLLSHGFPVPEQGSSFQDAIFKRLDPISIRAELVDGGIGSFHFRDPWWVSNPQTGEQPNIFRPFTGQMDSGVFLDQEYNPPGNPHYSVRALASPLPGYTWQFLGWEATGAELQFVDQLETPVVFRQANATVKAWYKAHLASSSTAVTAPNTQRKIVRDEQGTYHAVYESGGLLWYTKSTNNGADWSPEIAINFIGDITHKNPSVTYHRDPARLLVACESVDSDFSRVRVYQIDPASGEALDISPPPEFSQIPVSQVYSMNPVIAHGVPAQGEENTLVVWYDWEADMLKGAVRTPEGQWLPERDLLPRVTVFSLAPFSHGGSPWHLVWNERNNICYSPIPNTNPLTLGDIQMVAEGREDVSLELPTAASLLTEGQGTAVAWQARPLEFFDWTINFRQRSREGDWNTPITIVASRQPLRNASLGSDPFSENVVVAYQAGNAPSTSVAYLTRNGGKWSKVITLSAGVAPSASCGFLSGNEEQLLWRSGSAAPYTLNHAAVSFGSALKETKPGGAIAVEGRGGRISYPNGSIHFVILEPTLDSNNIAFTALQDTLSIRGRDAFEVAVRTGDFGGRGTIALRLLYKTTGTVPASARLRFELVDTLTGQTMNSIRTLRGRGDSSIAVRLPLVLGQRRVRLRVRVEGLSQDARYEVERWIVMPTDSSSSLQQSLVAKVAPSSATPTEYNLHAAYPNPFNPSTQINFELPDAGNVSLVVYDMLGREVANLVTGYREAGYHSTTWNASGQASGVYFARFSVINADGLPAGQAGKLAYSTVSKCVMMK